MSHFVEHHLGDFFRIKHGYAFKSAFFAKEGDYIVLTPGNFKEDGGLKSQGEKEKFYSAEPPQDFILHSGDLLTVMTDLTQEARILGASAFIREDGRLLHNQRLGKVIDLDTNRLDKNYLYHLFNWGHVRDQLKGSATGSTVRHTAPDRIYAVSVPIPPLPTQQRIASILSAYDDLIENNTRRIAILEEMARRLYEKWFVHFRFPGHEEVEFEETERGAVPAGWAWVDLSEMYRTSAGGTPSRKRPEFFEGEVRWVKSKELRDAPIFDTEERITEAGLRGSSAKLFPRNSVLIAMYGATIGQLGVLQADASTNQAICALLPSEGPHAWCYAYLSLLARRSELIDLRAGAAQQNVSQAIIKQFPLLRADAPTHQAFEQAVEPTLNLAFILHKKNANLRAQRDLLLPKLVSGEIDVSEAENAMEAAE